MILLDTSILIDMFRTKDKSQTYFYKLAFIESDFCISIITHYEILIGSNEYQTNYWNHFIRGVGLKIFDIEVSEKAIKIYKELKSQNKLIDLADLFIAATAIAHSLPIATLNKKHFSRIKELQLIEFNE